MNVERVAAAHEKHFAFGANWQSFLAAINDERIAEAEKSLQWLTGMPRLDGLRFLDIGCGSGLSSLAARRLGAAVHSFDYDAQSVECARMLRQRYCKDDAGWRIEPGSILDAEYLAGLGIYDIVYSWGVLHHTGAMHDAVRNAAGLVAPGGLFVFALYRKTRLCGFWTHEKRWYAAAPAWAQGGARSLYIGLMRLGFAASRRDFHAYVENYRSNRGMDYSHDVHDWLGGHPYESIRPADVERDMKGLGLQPVRSKVQPYSTGWFGSGCDEYVYRRPDNQV